MQLILVLLITEIAESFLKYHFCLIGSESHIQLSLTFLSLQMLHTCPILNHEKRQKRKCTWICVIANNPSIHHHPHPSATSTHTPSHPQIFSITDHSKSSLQLCQEYFWSTFCIKANSWHFCVLKALSLRCVRVRVVFTIYRNTCEVASKGLAL